MHGAALDALAHAVDHVEIELNAAAENPLVDVATDSVFSTGNFHIPGLAIAHEALGLAVAQVAAMRRRALHPPDGAGDVGVCRCNSRVTARSNPVSPPCRRRSPRC